MTQQHGALAPRIAAEITKRTARLSVAVAIMLIILKTAAWLASGSVAMLSSLADSALDLAAAIFTLVAVNYAATPPDREHRYGHGKAEAIAASSQAALVAGSGVFIAIEAGGHFVHPTKVAYGGEAILVTLISIALTGALVWAQTRAIKQTGSVATLGDRAHYIGDFGANIVVLIGIALSALFGWSWADAGAGLLVVAWLIYGAWGVAREATNQVLDHEMPNEDRDRISALAMADGQIMGVHDLRTRLSGPYVHVQFHADLAPDLSLAEAHHIIVEAENRIRAAYPAVDLIIHPDPGEDAEPHGGEVFGEQDRAVS